MDSIIQFDHTEGLLFFHGRGNVLKKLWLNVHFESRPLFDRFNDKGIFKIICDDQNRLHSITEPAYVSYYDGRPSVERWYFEAQIHRDDGPAITRPHSTKRGAKEYAWYWHGKVCGSSYSPDLKDAPKKFLELRNKHTPNLNESVDYKEDKKWEREIVPGHNVYHKSPQGAFHRTDGGPAVIKKDYMSWRKGGTFYREDDKPVVIDNENGSKRLCWMTPRGVLHRIYGPAHIVDGRNDWYVDANHTTTGHKTAHGVDQLSGTQLINHVGDSFTYIENQMLEKDVHAERYGYDDAESWHIHIATELAKLGYVDRQELEDYIAHITEHFETMKADDANLLDRLKR